MTMLHPRFALVLLVLALAACRPGAAEYTESEAPKNLTLDNATAAVGVRFAPRSSRLLRADAARLRYLAASGAIAPSDRVTVSAAGTPALAAARFQAIAAALLGYNVIAAPRPTVALGPNQAIIETQRYLVTLPPCPNWSKEGTARFANTDASNFGCATAVNLGVSAAYPADLAEGRPVGLAAGIPAAAAVQRYYADRVTLPTSATLGPIAVTPSSTPGSGATGAGTAGSQP